MGVKPRRPHPASPEAAAAADPAGGTGGESEAADPLVMLCVRVPRSLRRRVKLAALHTGGSVQELATEALEAACRRNGL
jgi:hypothetical protein